MGRNHTRVVGVETVLHERDYYQQLQAFWRFVFVLSQYDVDPLYTVPGETPRLISMGLTISGSNGSMPFHLEGDTHSSIKLILTHGQFTIYCTTDRSHELLTRIGQHGEIRDWNEPESLTYAGLSWQLKRVDQLPVLVP